MNKFVLALSLCCISSISFANSSDMLAKYSNLAKLATQDVQLSSFSAIDKSSAKLVDLAKEILPAFSENNPACKIYLDIVMSAADSMQQLSLEQIEADYHLDGKLPTLTNGDCYHAKDLLVHPATVVVMAKTLKDTKANRKKMQHEIAEVIQHLGAVQQAVK